jgi:hypothetical protein
MPFASCLIVLDQAQLEEHPSLSLFDQAQPALPLCLFDVRQDLSLLEEVLREDRDDRIEVAKDRPRLRFLL